MQIERLAPEVIAQIVAGRLEGFRPVSVRWPTGEFAIMFCVRGTDMPDPENIVKAYRRCRSSGKTFPQGDVSW